MIVENWFGPIKPMVAKWVPSRDWEVLGKLEYALGNIAPDQKAVPQQVKTLLASQGFGTLDVDAERGGGGCSSIVQALAQFICGYHNLDYRDAAHVGHSRMIVMHGSDAQRKLWLPKIISGALVGIAATEEHSGSRVQNTKTVARKSGSRHLLTGEKVYVSRLEEAAVFVTFFRYEQDEALSAALIKSTRKGFRTEIWDPVGLKGWSWGKIIFEDVAIAAQDVLGVRGQGMAIFKEHFVYYRPMVAMTALGLAGAVLDRVVAHINLRISRKDISVPRDTALDRLAYHHTSVNAALLSTLCAVVQNAENMAQSSLWSRGGKAWAVEQAYATVAELSLLMGAATYRAEHFVAKALNDLRGYLFADGIHDALRRSVGRGLVGLPL